jgi:membrane-bound serine protease (ClpP class)
VALLLAATALSIIPFNWAGLLLVLAGIGLLIAEVHLSTFGVLFALGLAALCWGAWLVFRVPEASDLSLPFWRAVFPVATALALVITAVGWSVTRAQARPLYSGVESLLRETGVAESDLAPEGRVRVRGELWNAVASGPVQRGERVEIVAVKDLVLHVRGAQSREGGG